LLFAPLVALGLLPASSTTVRAGDADDIRLLRDQIQALEEKLKVIERKQEIRDEAAATAAKSTPKVTADEKGLNVSSADGSTALHFGALVQFDSREFLGDGGGVLNNSFLLRRARLISDGTIGKYTSFLFVPEFGNGSGGTATAVAILDAAVTVAPTSAVQFKFGKFKSPLGLEELQGDPNTNFVERAFVSSLLPNRDVGAVVTGSLFGGALGYTAGLMNGISDSTTASGNSDFDNDKDVDGRLWAQPFVADKDSPLWGVGFGVGASAGREKGTSAVTAGYKTDGQQTFFKYGASVYADGEAWRVTPQASYYHGPFGALAEYVVSAVNVRPSAPTATTALPKTQLENKAWEITGSYVLTGEDASYSGVAPREPFNWANGTWGAWQVVGRLEDVRIDPKAFPTFAALATNANEARAWGAGFNWYLSRAVRLSQDFLQTRFSTNGRVPTTQILLHDETALITRVQLSF
jgi:phosphate-selective porin OprO/OprP